MIHPLQTTEDNNSLRDRAEALFRLVKKTGKEALPRIRRLWYFLKKPGVLSLGSGAAVFIFLLLTGLGDRMGENLALLTGPVPAAFIIFGVCFIPVLSSFIGPGLFIVLAAGVFTGEQIAAGKIIPLMALPLLLALDARLGGGFISSGLYFGEDEKETLNAGIPGIVFTRLILLPAAVLLTYIVSFSL